MLRITALVKHTPELTGDRRFAADLALDREGTEGQLSELDEHTAEQAIKLAEGAKAAGAELTYLTMGPPAAAEAPRQRWRGWATTSWSAAWRRPTARWARSRPWSPSASGCRRSASRPGCRST